MRGWTIGGAVLAGWLVAAAPGQAANPEAPALACTHKSWGFLTFNDHHFGTVNACGFAVTIWFLRRGHDAIEATVEPGAYFDTGLATGDFDDSEWSAAICRAGRAPDVAVTEEQWDAVLNDRYRCVLK